MERGHDPDHGLISASGQGKGPDAVAGQVARPDLGGVVPRPGLFGRLGEGARVTVLSAPPGSGKTVLLRSWITQQGLKDCAAWLPAARNARDPQLFWLSVVGAMRRTRPGSTLVQPLTAAPDLDGWRILERLLTDLAPLAERIWLVVDDLHELSPEVLGQLELLIMRAPPSVRFVLATRHDVHLGLHRLRLTGELAELREPDLRFSAAEAGELFAAADLQLPETAVVKLHEQTEGWAAGLRLAALSLAGHPDPARFAAEFSGTERTVAEYLLAEVLDRQSEPVRLLLLRTSILERVNGELADLLTGETGGERVLQDLERANAFVTSLDPGRTWFHYHQLFADLLALELRRAGPGEVAGLHRAAAGWFAAHGFAVEAIRHAQAAGDCELAAWLLADHWPGLYLDGQAAAVHELLAGFRAGARAADAELAVVAAADELAYGTLDRAAEYLALAERAAASVPDARQGQALALLEIVRLLLARQRGDLAAVAGQAAQVRTAAEALEAAQPHLGEHLRALTLVSLGVTELWAGQFVDAGRHLEQGVGLAGRIGRPFLEFTGLAYQALTEAYRSSARSAEHSRQAIELARRHGWSDEPAAGIAYALQGWEMAWQGRLDEAERWVQRAERTLRTESEPAAALAIRFVRGLLDLELGQEASALAASQAVQALAGRLATPIYLADQTRALHAHALARLGETGRAEQVLAAIDDPARDRGELHVAQAVLRLVQDDPRAATRALAPVLDGSVPLVWPSRLPQAFLLEAIAQDALGDQGAAQEALERALDLAAAHSALAPFLLHPAPDLLARHARQHTAHAALVSGIQAILAGRKRAAELGGPRPLAEPLSGSELRVLRYLPTNLTAPEIARELCVSRNTVKTHMRNVYAKLGTHRRAEAVARGRDLGLLAPSARR
jgi:LuxR family transcriptional regulator, maltose regulon positive regulatory protein